MPFLLDILHVIGALGLFIFGMKVMSENIQRVAGASMRRIINAITRSRIRGVLTGWLTTSLLQSSSATTVMTVSLVNAGVLRLKEAVGVIFGANIGTTITAWVIAFAVGRVDIRDFALPLIAIALPLLFWKRARLQHTAETLIGFALMFIGLQLLQASVPTLKGTPELFQFFTTAAEGRFASPLLFMLLGVAVAVIVQSSTAAIALTVALLSSGILTIEIAAAMVLGENIGTTVTANLAAVVANQKAKRAARIHTMINVIGVGWMIFLLPMVVRMIDNTLDSTYPGLGAGHDAVVIAVFHTGFNILNMFLLIGFTDQWVKLSSYFVHSGPSGRQGRIEYLGAAVMSTPELALLEVQKEMRRFARIVVGMNRTLMKLLNVSDETERETLLAELRSAEESTDGFKTAISRYLTEVAKEEVSDETSEKLRGLMSAANNLERMGDLFYRVAMNLERKNLQKVYFIPKQRESLREMTMLIDDAFGIMMTNLYAIDEPIDASVAKAKEREVNAMRDEMRLRHLKDLSREKYSQSSGVFYSDTFVSLEEVADHIFAVTEGLTVSA